MCLAMVEMGFLTFKGPTLCVDFASQTLVECCMVNYTSPLTPHKNNKKLDRSPPENCIFNFTLVSQSFNSVACFSFLMKRISLCCHKGPLFRIVCLRTHFLKGTEQKNNKIKKQQWTLLSGESTDRLLLYSAITGIIWHEDIIFPFFFLQEQKRTHCLSKLCIKCCGAAFYLFLTSVSVKRLLPLRQKDTDTFIRAHYHL